MRQDWTRKVFDFSGWIYKALPSKPDRDLLRRRSTRWLNGARRGRLNLPSYFPQEVRDLSKLTKSQVRQTIFWVSPEDGIQYRVPDPVLKFAHQVMPGGCIRTINGDIAVHEKQQAAVRPLPVSDWPRHQTRLAWPSTPSIVELTAMSRRGLTPLPMIKTVTPVTNCITRVHYNHDVVMRARIISNQVVGIRSDIEVPRRYLDYFAYRWNFLILVVRHDLPTGLVRFLTGQWIRHPANLWLVDKSSFRNFLKKTSAASFTSEQTRIGPW